MSSTILKHRARRLPSSLRHPLLRTCGLALLAVLISGCNVTKFLPEGKYLFDGSSVEVTNLDSTRNESLEASVTSVLNNKTNKKIPLIGYRGIYRWYKFEEKLAEKPEKFGDKEHWGEKPIFYSETVVESVNALLENRAGNEGYFNNDSEWVLDTNQSARTIVAKYDLTVGEPYLLDSIREFWTDTSIARRINQLQTETRLKKGDRYRLDAVKAERQLWQESLRRQGYYYLLADDFIFLADTVSGYHEVDMLAKLKDEVPRNHLEPQKIVQVNVFTNASSRDSTFQYGPGDTTIVGGIHVICQECPLRPKVVDEAFQQQEGDFYDPIAHRTTLKRLANYNTFRYIAMDYQPVPGSDSLLIMNAYMEPRLRRRFEGELGISYNSADYFGPNVKLAYINRNLLRGAELLKIEGEYTLAQFLGTAGEVRVPNSTLYGLTASLAVPRLWLPKKRKLIPRVTTSGSVIEIGAKVESLTMMLAGFSDKINSLDFPLLSEELENDPDASESLSLAQIKVQFGYSWSRRTTTSHLLNPLSVRLQNPIVSNKEVVDLAQVAGLSPDATTDNNRFDRMLVFSPNYRYTYDSRLAGLKTHSFYFSQFASMNMNNVFPVGTNSDNREREVSFYPLLDSDFRYYLTFDKKNQIATRIRAGAAFPTFSDRAIVPYFDLFSIGGPNSLRGFPPRGLGPGTTVPFRNNPLGAGGFGNVIFEASVEYRYRVIPLLELALFADAGNIWTYKTDVDPLITDFNTSTFSGQLGLDAGIGFRFDLQFLIFRLDLAMPLQTPYGEEELELLRIPYAAAREVPDNNLRLVIGFGYPF